MLKFKVLNLIVFNSQNTLVDKISSLRFAQDMAREIGMKMNSLAIVQFEQMALHQELKDWGLTDYDTLIIGDRSSEDFCLTMWVRLDHNTGLIVAGIRKSDQQIVITPVYKKYKNLIKLNVEQIKAIFEYVFNHPECILPEYLPPAG